MMTECIFDPGCLRLGSKLYADNLETPYLQRYNKATEADMHELLCVNDDKDLFISFLETYSPDIDYDSLWKELFVYDSVKCVKAVMDGETKGLLDLPLLIFFPGEYFSPLELAAQFGAPQIAKLLLARGDPHHLDPNRRNYKGLLPFNLAVNPSDRWHEPTDSILKELSWVCYPENRNFMETLRVFAQHTKEEVVKQEFIKYALEGKVQEITMILLVYCEKLMPLFRDLRKQILEKIDLLLVYVATSVPTPGHENLTQKRMFLQVTLALFDIFEKTGDKLSAYLRIPMAYDNMFHGVTQILEDAGFSEDNMNMSLFNLSIDQKILPTFALRHEGDIPNGAVTWLEGSLNPKINGAIVNGRGVRVPICARAQRPFQALKIPKTKAFNLGTATIPPPLRLLNRFLSVRQSTHLPGAGIGLTLL